MMTWTQKEASLLQDLKQQEQLCVDKYGEFSERACDPELRQLFQNIRATEQQHLDTVNNLINGQMPKMQSSGSQQQRNRTAQPQPFQPVSGQEAMQADKYLCMDALCTEKEVSGAYNTSIFEFRDPQVRQALHQIQGAEQQHGEMIYQYMARNGMYQAQ